MAYEIKYRSDNEMKDSGIEWLGKIPEEWVESRLKFIIDDFVSGGTPDSSNPGYYDEFNEGIPWITISDMSTKNIINKTQASLTELGIKNKNLKVLKKGTIIYSIFATLGKVSILSIDAVTNQAILGLIINRNKIKNQYLKYWLINIEKTLKYYSSSNTQENLNTNKVKNFKIIYDKDRIQQQKIANFLDIKTSEFDSIISKKEQLIEKLEAAKKSLISEVVTGKVKIVDGKLVDRKPEEMKDSGVEWLGTIPKDWEVKKIKHNTYVKGRIGWQGLRADEFTDEGPYLVTGTDFLNKSINWNNCYHISEKRYKEAPAIHLKDGDLLITKDGSIGKLAIVENCPDKAILNSGIFVTRCTNGEYLTEFMFYILSSNIFNIYIGLMTTGSTILHLYQSTFVNFIYPLPNIDIQSKLIQYLDNETNKINSIITKTQKQITKLKEAKQSLISEAVTGKIDLRDWEIIETGGR